MTEALCLYKDHCYKQPKLKCSAQDVATICFVKSLLWHKMGCISKLSIELSSKEKRQSQNSNPEQLGEKRKCQLCVMLYCPRTFSLSELPCVFVYVALRTYSELISY